MPTKPAAKIRRDFFQFFQDRGHALVPSAPVVPRGDSTLLFTNAGMNQFKSVFMGSQTGIKHDGKTWQRAVDTQRCIRVSGKHNDLEEVGRDTYHHTLFEMLGNWSFGDYFKKEAVSLAWELLVEVWELEPDRLYVTIFEGDEENDLPMDVEARDYWASETGINPAHILKGDKKDNFWEMGDTGPCGPCSEVHIDLRSDEKRKQTSGAELVNQDHPKVMEIWNLVFIQYNRQPDGSLEPLPAQHVDTGMGFERICAVLQGKDSNYDTDLFTPLLEKIGQLAGVSYGDEAETDIAMQVIADHIRSVSFAIADGAPPDNDGRGYVIRRILRRAVRYGWDKLDLKKPFFYKLVPVLADQFEDIFPVLSEQRDYVMKVIESEEESFLHTLGQGIELFNEIIQNQEEVSGEQAFKLHDTYGFPIDLTELMARERGKKVDRDGFEKEMTEQKKRSRAAGDFEVDQSASEAWNYVGEERKSDFVGYDKLQVQTTITGWRMIDDVPQLLLRETPFYAESGGQVADTGTVTRGDKTLQVKNVQKSDAGFIHEVGQLPDDLEGSWKAVVDESKRREIRKHHTVTHLLHAALRETLGDHVAQKGSLVDENHLRFDFSHYEQMTVKELESVEKQVNNFIQRNVTKQEEREVPIEQARERGAMMLFGEKYGNKVRVITFDPDHSVELCGGTHAGATGELGYFRILGESSAGAGVRRIEAVVGASADALLREEKKAMQEIQHELGQTENAASTVRALMAQNKELEKEKRQLQQQQASTVLDHLIAQAEAIGGLRLVTGEVPGGDMDLLKQLGYEALEKCKTGTITILGAKDESAGKVYVMASITDDVIEEKGLKAGALVGPLGQKLGGGGGGQPNLATAGGSKPDQLAKVLEGAKSLIEDELKDSA